MSDNDNNLKLEIKISDLQKRKLFLATPMYGGNSTGTFTKSVADLAAMCVKYGIQMQMYFLFNESLIPRARNYCCDEFMRSDCTHMMFIDADIGFDPNDVIALLGLQSDESEYDIIGGPYPKKSLDYKTKIVTEDGIQSLGKIVKTKYSGKVLSYNDNSGFEYKKIIAHHKTPKNGKMWVELRTTRDSHGKITSTYDHEVATVEDIFNPSITYKNAIDMENQYIVRTVSSKSGMNSENVAFSSDQMEFLYGTLLGDSSIKKNGQLSCTHSSKSYDYANLKAKLFDMKLKHGKVKIGDKIHDVVGLYGGANSQLKKLRELLYHPKKSLKNIIDNLSVKSLAMLYMDDGYLTKECSFICTEGFSDEDVTLLCNKLTSMGFDANPNFAGSKAGYRVRFTKQGTKAFHEKIAPFIIESMEYKILPEYRNDLKYDYNNVQKLKYSIQKIKSVTKLNKDMDQFDITVEDNFNFVTHGYLVHNCISWEKIKMAVDKGMADDNPEVLGNFVGDYVFNPKGGQKEIPLGKPVEVLEIGTGFMMIRKKTFEKFKEAFSQYSYRPDHVRTEHFDGSREIMMYFQAEIDPVSKRYLSEDYWFTQKCQEIGMKTWLCPWMKLSHTGTMVFGGSLVDLAQLGASATVDPSQLKKKKKG